MNSKPIATFVVAMGVAAAVISPLMAAADHNTRTIAPSIRTVASNTATSAIPILPSQILKGQLLKQGQINGQDTAMNPDIYASVNLGHLKKLKTKGMMENYKIHTHYKLELMVAAGNPTGITGPQDLARDDLVQSHPNPLTEGIFKFYDSAMLKEMGLYEKVTGNAKCKSCWAIEAKKPIRKIDGVAIPAPLNTGSVVGYAIGKLTSGRNQAAASQYLGYLRSDAAQNIYAKYGFVNATNEETALKPIP